MVALLMLVCGSMWADNVVTFTAGTDKSEGTTLTKDGVTLTLEGGGAQGAGNFNNAQYRIYKGATITVSATAGNITKVVFTTTASGTTKYGPGCFTAQDGYTYEDKVGTWSGSAASVVFSAESNQVRATSIEVTLGNGGGNTKKAAGLKFSEETVDHENGTEFTAPTFTKETSASVVFTSDNEEVATVSAEGVISLKGAEGKAVITAKSEANDEFEAGNATCTVYVWHWNNYKKADAVEAGKKYIIVAQRDDMTYYAMPAQESKSFGYLNTQKTEGTLNELKIKSSYDDTFTFESCGNGYAIKDIYGRYLYQNGTYNSFNLDKENAHEWSVEAQGDGTFKIAMNGYYMQFGDGTYTSIGVYNEKKDNTVLPMLFAENDNTGVSNIRNTEVRNDAIYNIAGQRVNKDYKGLVIVNGKKMIKK